jgi:hypothetical protein
MRGLLFIRDVNYSINSNWTVCQCVRAHKKGRLERPFYSGKIITRGCHQIRSTTAAS